MGVLAACGGEIPADTASGYLSALERTSELYRLPAEGSIEEARNLERIRDFFSNLGADDVATRTLEIYAPAAWFNDTLTTLTGADAIAAYFGTTAQNTDAVEVEIADISRASDGYYVKWVMTIRAPRLRDGQALRSAGMSHLRLDAAGRILVHQDFWDSAGGLFQYLPFAGGLVAWLRDQVAH
jgi:limonene-1,2-epoxide hydrolase